jgi:hypothetical protein
MGIRWVLPMDLLECGDQSCAGGDAMNILEARKLAEQGKTIIAPNGVEFTIADILAMQPDSPVRFDYVFGEWTEKREPLRRWVNVYPEYISSMSHASKDDADKESVPGRVRCVELVEVMK